MRDRMWIVALAVVACGISDPGHAAMTPVVTAAIHDYAGVPGNVLAEAEAEAAGIFRSAAVQLIWVDALETPATVHVSIVSAAMTQRTQTPPDVLGLASVPSGIVHVLFDRVAERAASLNVRASRVLAFVVAHEIGHVLLARHGHGHVGVMKSGLDPNVFRTGLIGFTREESRAMQASRLLPH